MGYTLIVVGLQDKFKNVAD